MYIIIFLSLQYIFFSISIFSSAFSNLQTEVYLSLITWGFLIVLIQAIVVTIISKTFVRIIFGTLFASSNFLLFYQAFDLNFINMNIVSQFISIAFSIIIFGTLIYMSSKHKIINYGLAILYTFIGIYIYINDSTLNDKIFSPNKITYFNQDISNIKFDKKPDVHIVIYDSMVSKRGSLQSFNKVPSYYNVMNRLNVKIFENSFVERVPTRPSLRKFIALGDGSYPYGIIIGQFDSPLAKIFRQNGYYILVGTRQGYGLSSKSLKKSYGKIKKNFFNEYYYENLQIFSSSPFCIGQVSSGVFKYIRQYYSFCDLASKFFQPNRNIHGWPEKILTKFKKLTNSKPILSLSYMYYPIGHTGKDYDYKDNIDRKKYLNYFDDASNYLSDHFERFFKIINERNKPAVILIFGDHGTFAKRGNYKNNKEKAIDMYNVFTGISFIETKCKNLRETSKNINNPTSPAKLMVDLINCFQINNVDKLVYPPKNIDLEMKEKYNLTLEEIIR